ncbi:MAG: DUF1254 domain-containing protein [Pseudomonadota bacterium]
MIRPLILPASAFAAVAVIAHMLTLSALPSVIMGRAVTMMEERGTPLHAFALAPRATPDEQNVVRMSPDVAYSVCRFDLSEGPVLVKGAAWVSYASLNVYDSETDNIVGIDLGPEEPAVTSAVLRLRGDDDVPTPEGVPVYELNKAKGVAVIRRLAPSDEIYAMVVEAARGDVCRVL